MDTYQMVSELNRLYPEKTFVNAHTPGCTVRAYYDALCRLTPLPPAPLNTTGSPQGQNEKGVVTQCA